MIFLLRHFGKSEVYVLRRDVAPAKSVCAWALCELLEVGRIDSAHRNGKVCIGPILLLEIISSQRTGHFCKVDTSLRVDQYEILSPFFPDHFKKLFSGVHGYSK